MDYYDWLLLLIVEDMFPQIHYQKLLKKLYNTEFIYIIDLDSNRASDGISLRYRYDPGYKHRLDEMNVPCSMLEMLVALANRCEEEIMSSPDKGDRKGMWFWNMILTMGLNVFDDDRYDENGVDYIINRFLRREYDSNGIGGLFTIMNPPRDVTQMEIWEQLNWYLSENYFN